MPLDQPKSLPKISILMYHQVGKFAEPKNHRACYCDQDSFRRQMAFLKFAGYRVISLKEACAALFGNHPLPRRSVVLTFDDGYENFAEHAFPILQDYGYPSVVFAVSGLLGEPAKWLEGGGSGSPLMSAKTLKALRAGCVEIGSHTVSHPRLSRLPPEQVQIEIAASKSALEEALGEPVDFFAYPYGDFDAKVKDAVIAAGYKAAVTCSRGAAHTAPNPYEIPRKGISYGDNLAGYFWKLAMKNKRKDRYA